MNFSEQELVCFNSILDGKRILGIQIDNTKDMESIEYVNDTISSLKEKGIMDSEGKLTKLGILPIRSLELYKSCDNYLIINNTCCGLINDSEAIIIKINEDSYDIYRVNKLKIVTELLEKCPFLRGASSSYPQKKSKEISIELTELLMNDYNYTKDSIHMIKYIDKNVTSNKIYFYDDNQGFRYDLIGKKLIEVQPCDIKRMLIRDLEIHSD